MGDCTHEKALSIAIKYLGEQYLGHLDVTDVVPDDLLHGAYNISEKLNECWVIYVPPPFLMVGGSHYIVISKKTGKIIFNGMVGE